MEGLDLSHNGTEMLSQRLQNSAQPDEIVFLVDNGEELVLLPLQRQLFSTIKKEKGSYVEVR